MNNFTYKIAVCDDSQADIDYIMINEFHRHQPRKKMNIHRLPNARGSLPRLSYILLCTLLAGVFALCGCQKTPEESESSDSSSQETSVDFSTEAFVSNYVYVPNTLKVHELNDYTYLLPDGEMTEELVGRCKAAAAAAKAFPDSIIVCTGGATGANNPDGHTEAGLMKEYLVKRCGISRKRICAAFSCWMPPRARTVLPRPEPSRKSAKWAASF